MINSKQKGIGFILKINEDSQIKDVIFKSENFTAGFKNENFSKFVEKGSIVKYFSLLKEIKEKEVIFRREINLNLGKKTETYLFTVFNNLNNDIIIIASNQTEDIIKFYEELMKINNQYVNNLRTNIKDKIVKEKPSTDEEIYNEMSKLNNQLVNLQRELNKKNTLLKAEKEKYRITLASIGEGVISADSSGNIVYLNSQAEKMLGWSLEEIAEKDCNQIFNIDSSSQESNGFENLEARKEGNERINILDLLDENKEINNSEAILTAKDGSSFTIEFSLSLIEETGGKVIIFRDISERKNFEQRLKKYASTDQLTEVLNRRAGIEYLEAEIGRIKKVGSTLSVIFIDINNLKLVNDNFGHQEGDKLLQQVSDILQQSLRQNDKVVRLGGDEFLLILPNSNKKSAEKIWSRIKKKFKEATKVNSKGYKISASHGIAEYEPENPKNVDQLINQADQEMYEEKKKIKSLGNGR